MLATGQAQPSGVTLDATHLYWLDEGLGAVMSAPLGGGAPTVVAGAQASPRSIAVDSTSVYWTNESDGGVIARAPTDGGTVTVLALATRPSGIAVDATYVYWTDVGAGTVMAVPIDGGTPLIIASGQPCPQAVAVNATRVYWTNFGESSSAGTVMGEPTMKAYHEIKRILVTELGFHDLAAYTKWVAEVRPTLRPTPEAVLRLSPDEVDCRDFWRVCDNLFGTDPVCNLAVPPEVGKLPLPSRRR